MTAGITVVWTWPQTLLHTHSQLQTKLVSKWLTTLSLIVSHWVWLRREGNLLSGRQSVSYSTDRDCECDQVNLIHSTIHGMGQLCQTQSEKWTMSNNKTIIYISFNHIKTSKTKSQLHQIISIIQSMNHEWFTGKLTVNERPIDYWVNRSLVNLPVNFNQALQCKSSEFSLKFSSVTSVSE